MPVITVDDEVWKELQRRSEPLVDTANSVLRRILDLERKQDEVKEKVIDIVLNNLHSPQSFGVIPIPKSLRTFFPGFKIYFDLVTDIGTIRTRVTSAPGGTPIGDPLGGAYIQGGLKPWYEKHTELKPGDKLRFENIDDGRKYRLSLVT